MNTRHFLPSAFFATVIAASVFGGSRMSAQRPLQARSATTTLRSAGRLVVDTAKLYTEAQATDGATVWTNTCAGCHEAKDVTSADFRTKWVGRSLFALYEQIRTTMPDEQYLHSVAYILKLNGLPAGEIKLVADSASLSALTFALPAPPATP